MSNAKEIETIPTNLVERILIFLLVATGILEANLPTVGGLSTPFIVFGVSTFYVLFYRFQYFIKVLQTRFFVYALFFSVLCTLIETLHLNSYYKFVNRFFFMSIGALAITAICRDKKAFNWAVNSLIIMATIQSIILYFGTAASFAAASTSSFQDASKARIEAYEDFSLEENLNIMSFFCGLGATMAAVKFLHSKKIWFKIIYAILAIITTVGVFLPVSRSGAVVYFATLGIFVFRSGINVQRFIPIGLVFGAVMLFLVPSVFWARFASLGDTEELAENDSRSRVYGNILKGMPDFFAVGVGSGQYWYYWAVRQGITPRGRPSRPDGAHNAYAQIWVYWGLPAILMFIGLIRSLGKFVSFRIKNKYFSTVIFTYAIFILFEMLFAVSWYEKTFAVFIGLTMANQLWQIEEKELLSEKNLLDDLDDYQNQRASIRKKNIFS